MLQRYYLSDKDDGIVDDSWWSGGGQYEAQLQR